MPQSRSSDRSSRHSSSSRSYKKSNRTAPVKQVITRIVKPLVEYESDSSLSSSTSPVPFKENRSSSSKSLASQARIVVKTSKNSSNKSRSGASRSGKGAVRSQRTSTKVASSVRRQRKDSITSPRSKKRKTRPRSKSHRRSSSSDDKMDGRRVQHPYDYGPGSYPPRSPNSFKSNYSTSGPQGGPRESWDPAPYDRLRSPSHNYPPRPQSPGYSHSGGRNAAQIIRRSPSHSPHFHGSGSPRRSDFHETRRFVDRDGRQFAPRSPRHSPSYTHGNSSHSPQNTGFVDLFILI